MTKTVNTICVAMCIWGCLLGCQCNKEQPRSFTMLHDAAWHGDKAAVEKWLSRGEDVHALDKHGRTPLSWAAQYGHKDIAEILIAHGADPNDGSLTYAVAASHSDTVEFLLSKGAIPGGDPLVQASRDGNLELIRVLISKGANVDAKGVDAVHGEPGRKPYDSYGNTPLHVASEYGRPGAVKLLLESKAKVNLKGRDGYPLGAAAANGHKAIVEMLLSGGANVTTRDDARKTASELAAENGHKDIADIIRKTEAR